MHRRSFMQGIAAAFGTVALLPKVSFATPSEIRWELFTDLVGTRYDLHSPFVAMGKTIATDGRILIAFDNAMGEPGEQGRFPNMEHLNWNEFSSPVGWMPHTELTYATHDAFCFGCPDCYGLGGHGANWICECQSDPSKRSRSFETTKSFMTVQHAMIRAACSRISAKHATVPATQKKSNGVCMDLVRHFSRHVSRSIQDHRRL